MWPVGTHGPMLGLRSERAGLMEPEEVERLLRIVDMLMAAAESHGWFYDVSGAGQDVLNEWAEMRLRLYR